jgi:hypothetical protein
MYEKPFMYLPLVLWEERQQRQSKQGPYTVAFSLVDPTTYAC